MFWKSKVVATLPFVLLLVHTSFVLSNPVPQNDLTQAEMVVSDRDQDGLVGPVRKVRTETAKITVNGQSLTEGPRVLLEDVTYDAKGNKLQSAYYPAASGSLTGREVYKYDDRGNIAEMSMFNADGTLLAKEVYKYEFDKVGNWTRMLTSVAIFHGGKVSFDPSEVTYRSITYYLGETLANRIVSTGNAAEDQTPGDQQARTKAESNSIALNGTGKPASISGASTIEVSNPPASGAEKPEEIAALQPAKPKPPLRPISHGVLNGIALKLPKPVLPEMIRRLKITGQVVVEVVIDGNGKVISARAVKGHPALHQPAVDAAYGARFTPTLLSGQPVKVSGVITYRFALSE
jgi:TonB family protein